MDLADYLAAFRKRWWLVFAALLVALGIAAAVTALSPRFYTGRSSVFFSVQGANSAGDLASGSTYAERQVKSYAQVAASPVVLDPVIKALGLETNAGALARRVTATVPTGTVIIEISARDSDPARAAEIANAAAKQLATAVHELSPKDNRGEPSAAATVIREALPNPVPTSPNMIQNLVLAALLGLVAGAVTVVLLDRFDTKVHSLREVEQLTDQPVIGIIPVDKDNLATMVGEPDPASVHMEAFRRLRTNLAFLSVDQRPKWFVITSSVPGEGKSVTSIRLAMAMAQAGSKVLLVEADLRRPTIPKYLGLEGAAGLTSVLIGQASLDDVIQPSGVAGMDVLSAGPLPPNPSELLGSHAMDELLTHASERYDSVIVDSPPLLPVTDAAILAGAVGGALLVVGNEVARRDEVAQALSSLANVDVKQIGIIFNRAPVSRGPYSYTYTPDDSGSRAGSSGKRRRTRRIDSKADSEMVLTATPARRGIAELESDRKG